MQGHLMTLAAVLAASLSASRVLAHDVPRADAEQAGPAQGKLDKHDQDFLINATLGGMLEVKTGELAATKGDSSAVKSFGKKMAEEHAKLNGQIRDLAQKKGVTLPGELDKKHKDELDALNKKTGADFDKAYASHAVSDHQKDVDDFQKEVKDAKDPDVKAFASGALPMLRDHLDMAKSLEAMVKKK